MNKSKYHQLLRMGVESLNFSCCTVLSCSEKFDQWLRGKEFKGRIIGLPYRIIKVGDWFNISLQHILDNTVFNPQISSVE